MNPRRAVLIAVLSFAVAAAAYGGYWLYAADRLESGIDTWIEQRRQEGIEVRFAWLTVDGFPFALNLNAGDVVVVGASGNLAWEVRAPMLHVVAAPWDLNRQSFETPGAVELTFADVATGQRAQVTAAEANGNTKIDGSGRLRAGDIRLQRVSASGSGPFLPLSARVLSARFDRLGEAAEMAVRAFEMVLPPLPMATLGKTVQSLTASLVVHGRIPDVPTANALDAWRRAGGRVDIRYLEAMWGPLTLSASGEASLDGNLQPTGKLSTSTVGYREAITAVEASGQMSRQQAAQLRLALDIMATRPAVGGAARLDADLRVVDRRLYAGILPLADLPHIRWPQE